MSTENPGSELYRKHFIPLESNPDVFTELIRYLGVSPSLSFVDVFSVDDKDLLGLVPRPVLALILVFPTSEAYERHKKAVEDQRADYSGSGEDEQIVWFKQTINNACGLYGILHAVCNGEARDYLEPNSVLSTLLKACVPLPPQERALCLENTVDLERAHAEAARQGSSAVPENPEDEVDFHYITFVRSHKNGHLYEMDGDSKGPTDRGPLLAPGDDLLSEGALGAVREYIQREKGDNLGFSLLALVSDSGGD